MQIRPSRTVFSLAISMASLLEVADAILALTDRPKTLKEYVADRPGHDRRYLLDHSKLERELGWKPAETFDTGIRKTVEWYLANGEWVRNVQSGAYREWVQKHYAGEPAKAAA